MKSRNYSESEKSAAIERFLVGGESVSTIAADTGISRSTLYAWIKSAQTDPAGSAAALSGLLLGSPQRAARSMGRTGPCHAAPLDCGAPPAHRGRRRVRNRNSDTGARKNINIFYVMRHVFAIKKRRIVKKTPLPPPILPRGAHAPARQPFSPGLLRT